MGKAERDLLVPYEDQREPDLGLGLLGRKRIIRIDGRYTFVQNVRTRTEAQDRLEDIEEATGVLLWVGHAIDINKTSQKERVIEQRFGVGLWQRKEP